MTRSSCALSDLMDRVHSLSVNVCMSTRVTHPLPVVLEKTIDFVSGPRMQVTAVLFVSEANTLVAGASFSLVGSVFLLTCCAGTSTGDLLLWHLSTFWSAAYWTSPESASDARLPAKRVNVMSGPVARVVQVRGQLFVAGREGLVRVALDTLLPGGTLRATPQQRCFNGLAWDETTGSLIVGAEDGSLLQVNPKMMESSFLYEPGDGQSSPVLDVAVGPSAVFAALCNGCVIAVDRETRAAAWRINLRRGEVENAVTDSPATSGGFRATVVLVDPSGKWLLCGAGSNAASKEGGFLSVWHAETREVISVLPMRSCPSSACWLRGAIICCGAENALYQYDLRGQLVASSITDSLSQGWDVAAYSHPDDVVGSAIAMGGAGGYVLLYTAVGRKPISLQVE